MNITNWKESVAVDDSIEKINIYEYEPHQGTRLNDVGDIRITINNEDQFIHPSESSLYIEGELTPKSSGAPYNTNDDITLVNNGLMYLFKRIDYSIANKKIEGFNNPGRATTMKGLLTYPLYYPEGMSFMWMKDENNGIADNDGFMIRRSYIHEEGNGKFSALIPLTHIFGFCENYKKIMYGAKHELTLQRMSDEDAIHRSDEKEGAAGAQVDRVKKGNLILKKISWRMPVIKLSDESKINLFTDIQKKEVIPIEFLSRQCESLELHHGTRNMDWRLSVATGSERPRYVVLGFQKNRLERDTVNSAVFDSLDVRNAHIEFNGESYPDHDLSLEFDNNQYVLGYQLLTNFYRSVMGRESCSVRIKDFKKHYCLLVFDISRQSERMKHSASDIRIKAEFNTNLPRNCIAYALVLSDREISIQSDGNRMNVLQ